MLLSVIIPAYNEEGNVENTARTVGELLSKNSISHELIFVNDGSSDKTWEKLLRMAESSDNIVAVGFSRNFGKESAIFAGLKAAKGDACVVMDCDLQHPPETIIEMVKVWQNNDVDVVEGKKSSRGKESAAYKVFSKLFYKLIKKASGIEMEDASDFKLLDRKAVDALNEMPERLTFFRALSGWVGFKSATVYFDVAPRAVGERKWTTSKLIKYAVNSISSFTSAPLQIVTGCGVVFFIAAVILAVNTLINKITGKALGGFSTVILLQLIIGSVVMFSLGIIGYYISKIYEEIKCRPRYIIDEIVKSKNLSDESKDKRNSE